MAKFNYIKWVTENKYGKLSEDDQVHGSSKATGLSSTDPQTADATIGGGAEDGDKTDDQVAGTKLAIAVQSLKPAQSEIILVKAFNMALNTKRLGGEYPAGGDIGAIGSKDNYIMDGHHRWAATYLVDPSATVEVTQIELPGGPLVTALNLYTRGKLGIDKGNKGSGKVSEFTGANIQSKIIDPAKESGKSPDSPDGKANGYKWEEIEKRLTALGGGNFDKGLAQIKANADALPKQIMPGAPARVEMPVIAADKVADVKMRLEKGLLDIKPPYSPELKKAMGGTNTSLGDEPQKAPVKQTSKTGLGESEPNPDTVSSEPSKPSDEKTLGDVELVVRNIDKINTQQELQQVLKKIMDHISAGNVTGGSFALNSALGTTAASAIKKQFGIKETKDPRASLYERLEKHINK